MTLESTFMPIVLNRRSIDNIYETILTTCKFYLKKSTFQNEKYFLKYSKDT